MRVTSLFDHVRQQWIRGCINTHVFSDGLQWCFTSTLMFLVMFYINSDVLQWCFTSTVMFFSDVLHQHSCSSVMFYIDSDVLSDVLLHQSCSQRCFTSTVLFSVNACRAVQMIFFFGCVLRCVGSHHDMMTSCAQVGGWGRVPFSRNLMSPTPCRKWYLTTGRRAH